MKHHLLSILIAASLTFPLFGEEAQPRPDIDELLKVMRMEKLYADVMERMQGMMAGIAKKSEGSAAAKEKGDAIRDKVYGLLKTEMGWDKMESTYAKMYADIYTPDEVKGIVAFYKSPAGQAFLDKQPVLMQKTMEMTQKLMTDLMPKIQEITKEAIAGKAGAGGATPDLAIDSLSGKFLLSEHPKDVEALDAIEFKADGSCVFDLGDRKGIAGKYHIDHEGDLSIKASNGNPSFIYGFQRLKNTLVLSHEGSSDLYYVSPPDAPHPAFSELIGAFYSKNDLGESAGDITADHHFHAHLYDFVPEGHTYYDVSMDGTCTYENGIVTYSFDHSNAPVPDQYFRDFVVKRDEKGLWLVDPFHDAIICETPTKNLDLPAPPDGYKPVKR